MEFIDIIIGSVFAFSFYKGFKNGIFVELASLLAFFLGLFLSVKFSYITSSIITQYVNWSQKTVQITSFIITLSLVIIGVHALAKILSGIANLAFMGWANTLLGGLFGIIKSMLLLGIVFNLFQKININNFILDEEKQNNSLFYLPCIKTSQTLLPLLTDGFEALQQNTINNQNTEENKQIINLPN